MNKETVLVTIEAALPSFADLKKILNDIRDVGVGSEDEIEEMFTEWGVSEIVKALKLADDAYYTEGQRHNLTSGQLATVQSIFVDGVYDAYFDYLKANYPSNPYLKKVGAPVQKSAQKEKLPFYLGSLDKVKPNTVDRWLEKNPGPVGYSGIYRDYTSVLYSSHKAQYRRF